MDLSLRGGRLIVADEAGASQLAELAVQAGTATLTLGIGAPRTVVLGAARPAVR